MRRPGRLRFAEGTSKLTLALSMDKGRGREIAPSVKSLKPVPNREMYEPGAAPWPTWKLAALTAPLGAMTGDRRAKPLNVTVRPPASPVNSTAPGLGPQVAVAPAIPLASVLASGWLMEPPPEATAN